MTIRRIAASDPAAVRARLVELVERDGRSVSAIAAAAGMGQPQLHQVLSGVKAAPSVRTIGRVLAALGLPWSALDG